MGWAGIAGEEEWLARHEGTFDAEDATPLGMDELLLLLGAAGRQDSTARRQAIAKYLSGEAGWRDAVGDLHGAFAEEAGLRERKAD